MLDLVAGGFLSVHSNTNYVYTKLGLCASWTIREEPVIGSVSPPSRRFLNEKQGTPSPSAAKRGQPKLHHDARQEKTPDPFVLFPWPQKDGEGAARCPSCSQNAHDEAPRSKLRGILRNSLKPLPDPPSPRLRRVLLAFIPVASYGVCGEGESIRSHP